MASTTTTNGYAGGATMRTNVTQNVATAGTPLTTAYQTVLVAQTDAGIGRRSLMVTYTGDQTLTLGILYDLGVSGVGPQLIATIAFAAGNGTTQTAMFFPTSGTTSATGTCLVSGTAPVLALAGSWDFLDAPANTIRLDAKAGGTTTVGSLGIDLMEISN